MNSPKTGAEAVARVKRSARTRCEDGLFKLEFNAMSTLCSIKAHGAAEQTLHEFFRDVVAWVGEFEAKYSRFIPDSLIGRVNAAAGEHSVDIDPETSRLFDLCQELFFFTRGSFDPTALPLIKLWNWKQYPPALPDENAIRAARELVGWNKVQRRTDAIYLPQKGMSIDLGGIGKEYAVDGVTNMAIQRGIPNILVDFGQDIRVRGHAPGKEFWYVGLENPLHPGKCWAGVAVTDHAVATSGDYLRHFQIDGRRYGHIIDPRTGYPAFNDCRAASVIAPSCTIAGLLSTSICIVGAKEGLQLIEMHPQAAGVVSTEFTKLYSRKFHEYIPA